MSINSFIWSKESQILDHNHLTVNQKLPLCLESSYYTKPAPSLDSEGQLIWILFSQTLGLHYAFEITRTNLFTNSLIVQPLYLVLHKTKIPLPINCSNLSSCQLRVNLTRSPGQHILHSLFPSILSKMFVFNDCFTSQEIHIPFV